MYNDRISLSDALPGITVPTKCKSGQDIVFDVPTDSGDRISEGDTLVEIIFYRTDNSYNGHYADDVIERQPVVSKYSGYIVHTFGGFTRTIDDLSSPIFIYPTIEDLIDERYPIYYRIKQDEFTAVKSIEWILNNSDEEDSYYSKYRLTSSTYFDLNIEKNLPVIVFGFSRKIFNVNKQDTISFKFEDGRVLNFPVLAPPVKNSKLKSQRTVSISLSASDIDVFEKVHWEKMRIEHFNGDAPDIIEHKCLVCQSEGFAKAFFKKYIQEYKRILNELDINLINVPSKHPVLRGGDDAQKNDACYVYLMIDTSNGYHKIGISNHPNYRERTLQSEKPTIEKICAKRYPSRLIAQSIESALHTAFASKRIRGEWFNLSEQDVEQIVETLA